MRILDMITEWEKGCSCAFLPWECAECTISLIRAIKILEEKKINHTSNRPNFNKRNIK